jgi:hypothetical protein
MYQMAIPKSGFMVIKRLRTSLMGGSMRCIAQWCIVLGVMVLGKPSMGQKAVCLDKSPACHLLKGWFKQGKASGNIGDYYDNRDRGHAKLKLEKLQVQVVEYSKADRRTGRDYSGPRQVRPHATIGNASLSATMGKGGSVPRLFYLTESKGIDFLHTLYRHNNLYVFPEHRDHDPGRSGIGGYGDLYPINTPYLIISQGSSGSDMRFVEAGLKTLAAFRPAVKQKLIQAGLLMPTLQMILRWSNKSVQNDAVYLTGKAHPTVFDKRDLDVELMVRLAQEIAVEVVPPLVQLEVLEEDRAENGRDYFSVPGTSEKLADTPAAIGRIFRRTAGSMRLVVSARSSIDANGRPLRFEWVVLRGDNSRIRIEPRAGGREAVIEVPYHGWQPLVPGENPGSNRVDIGVFAHNGVYYSPPSFISIAALDNEERQYDERGNLVYIDYAAGKGNLHLEWRSFRHWDRIFDWLFSEPPAFEAMLLKKYLAPRQIQRFGKLASKSSALLEAEGGLLAKKDSLNRVLKRVEAKLKELDDADEGVALKKARRGLKREIREITEIGWGELAKNGRALGQLFHVAAPEWEESPRQVLLAAFEAMAADITLYPLHAEKIHLLSPKSGKWGKKGRDQLWDLRQKLLAAGLMHELPDMRLMLGVKRVRAGLGPFERRLFRRLNLTAMQYFLYPKIILPQNKVNHVDWRLGKSKAWRDLYEYDPSGRLLGWNRFWGGGRKAQRYTAAGLLVTKRDATGKPSHGSRMRYVVEDKGKNKGTIVAQPYGVAIPLP